MRIAIDINDVRQCTPIEDDQLEYYVVLTGPSGKSVFEAWKQKLREQTDQPQLQL
jgi:hypothetical protein